MDSSPLNSAQTGPGTHPASYPMGTVWALSPGVKWRGREVDHSPQSSSEVKNGEAIPPLPDVSSWCGAQLIKHRGIFTFMLAVMTAKSKHAGQNVICHMCCYTNKFY
jgi:hypothetical protein